MLWQRLDNVGERRCLNIRKRRRHNSHFRPCHKVMTTLTTTLSQRCHNVAVPAGKKICSFYGQNRIYIYESKRNEGSKLIKVSQECFLQQCVDYDQL